MKRIAVKFIKEHCDTTDGLLNPFDAAEAMIEFSRLKCIEELTKYIEHPSKPGYKRHDIVNRIEELKRNKL
jgi:hypothetical protein